ncbi:MAG: hypothetical protein WDN28_17740 [Chthoniobacter sp.]
MILELVSFILICSAWGMLLVVPVLFIPAMFMRLRLGGAGHDREIWRCVP